MQSRKEPEFNVRSNTCSRVRSCPNRTFCLSNAIFSTLQTTSVMVCISSYTHFHIHLRHRPSLLMTLAQVAQRYLGGNHAVTITLRNSNVAARRAISARDSKVREDLLRRKGRGNRGTRPKQAVAAEMLGQKLTRCSPRSSSEESSVWGWYF